MPYAVALDDLSPFVFGTRDTPQDALAYAKASFGRLPWRGTDLSISVFDALPAANPAGPKPRRKFLGAWVDSVTVESWVGTGTVDAPAMQSVKEYAAALQAAPAGDVTDTEGPLQVDGQYYATFCGPNVTVEYDTDDNPDTTDNPATDGTADDVGTAEPLDWVFRAVPAGTDETTIPFSGPQGPSWGASGLYPGVGYTLQAQDASEEVPVMTATYTAPAFIAPQVNWGSPAPVPNNVTLYGSSPEFYSSALFKSANFYNYGNGTIFVGATVDRTETAADPCTWGYRDTYIVTSAVAHGFDSTTYSPGPIDVNGFHYDYGLIADSAVQALPIASWDAEYPNQVHLPLDGVGNLSGPPAGFITLFITFTVQVRRTYSRQSDGATRTATSPPVDGCAIIAWAGNPPTGTATGTPPTYHTVPVSLWANRSGKEPVAVEDIFHLPHRVGSLYSGASGSVSLFDFSYQSYPLSWPYLTFTAPMGKGLVGYSEAVTIETYVPAPGPGATGSQIVFPLGGSEVYADGPETFHAWTGPFNLRPPGAIGVLVPVDTLYTASPNPPAGTVYPLYATPQEVTAP